MSELQHLRDHVPRLALDTPFRGGTLCNVAREVVRIAEQGLMRRGLLDRDGEDEHKYLAQLIETAGEGRSPADILMAEYVRDWQGNIDRLFDAHAL
jgi:glutamate--cysteine ligase